MTRTAIIDLGTNTFHLLVAEWDERSFRVVWNERRPTKLGVGGINRNLITPEARDRALTTLKAYRQQADQLGVSQILAFGTSALRNAANGAELAYEIKRETGIETRIISGDREAELIYEGVNLALHLGNDPQLIVDIGGGSVEFIIANGADIRWKQSFEIGGQRLLEKFQHNDPILPQEIEALQYHCANVLAPLRSALAEHQPNVLAGSSGTFDTLSEIYCHRHGLTYAEEPETPFDIHSFPEIYHDIISRDRQGRMQIPGMIELRVDMISVACALVDYILRLRDFRAIRVSSYSLKEGVLARLMKGQLP